MQIIYHGHLSGIKVSSQQRNILQKNEHHYANNMQCKNYNLCVHNYINKFSFQGTKNCIRIESDWAYWSGSDPMLEKTNWTGDIGIFNCSRKYSINLLE